jgi:hypothetical protein
LSVIAPDHVLLGTLTENTLGADPLHLGTVCQQLRDAISEGWPPHSSVQGDEVKAKLKKKRLPLNAASKRVLAWAVLIADQAKPERSIGVDDLILGIWREGTTRAALLLDRHFSTQPELAAQLDVARRMQPQASAIHKRSDTPTLLLVSFGVIFAVLLIVLIIAAFRSELR